MWVCFYIAMSIFSTHLGACNQKLETNGSHQKEFLIVYHDQS